MTSLSETAGRCGHRLVCGEDDLLKVSGVPDKGTDVAELMHKPRGVDCLAKTPWELRPPRSTPAADFLDNSEVGWPELFRRGNNVCQTWGSTVAFHGVAPMMPGDTKLLTEAATATVLLNHPFLVSCTVEFSDDTCVPLNTRGNKSRQTEKENT